MKVHMPTYKKIRWNNYVVRIFPEERDTLRTIFFLIPSIVPYFWDTDINLDMTIDPPKNIQPIERRPLEYKWELCDLDNNVIRSGKDSYEFQSFLKSRKRRAIKIGFLKPQQGYRLNIILTDIYGTSSDPLQIASFTIKDKDEVYTQIFLSLITIFMGIVIGLLARGCS
jgi:hypothetical protein